VLGDMGELGARSAEFHRDIGVYARARNISGLYAIGEASREAVAAFGSAGAHAASLDELVQMLGSAAAPQATLLVKGSRFMQMERVVAALAATGEEKEERGEEKRQ
jgi:UDP-N-acetylmuramoyl-tripeptide--D-alanyl-D-alanine ligase